MNNLTNTVFFLLASPLQLLVSFLLMPFAKAACDRAMEDDNYYYLEFEELLETHRCHESFYGPGHEKTIRARYAIRQHARKCIKGRHWNREDVETYLALGRITQSDIKGLRY